MRINFREIIDSSYVEQFAKLEATSGAPLAWSSTLYQNEFSNPNVRCYGAFDSTGELSAFIIFQVVIDEADVSNFVVKKELQGQGLGTELFRQAITALKDKGCLAVTLEVREHNYSARRVYAKLGFKEVAQRKGYYQDTGEIALLMKLDL